MGNLGQIRFEEPCTTFLSGDFGKRHDHPTSRTDHETEDLCCVCESCLAEADRVFGCFRRRGVILRSTDVC